MFSRILSFFIAFKNLINIFIFLKSQFIKENLIIVFIFSYSCVLKTTNILQYNLVKLYKHQLFYHFHQKIPLQNLHQNILKRYILLFQFLKGLINLTQSNSSILNDNLYFFRINKNIYKLSNVFF